MQNIKYKKTIEISETSLSLKQTLLLGILAKYFKDFQIKGKIKKGQFNNLFKMLSLKCTIDGHEEQQIIGICENVNCTSQRKVCLECIKIHQQNDQQFMISDIKNEKGLEKIFNQFKDNNINKINNIYIQCYIQQYFLYIEMLEYIELTRLKYQQLANIINDLDKFSKETWNQINTTNYIQNNNNIGAQTYLSLVISKLDKIDQAQNEYLFKISDGFVHEIKQELEKSDKIKIIDQFIGSIQREKDNVLKKIISNDLYKKDSANVNPSEEIFRIMQKQDQELQSHVLCRQYHQIQSLISDDGKKFLIKTMEDSQKAKQDKEKYYQLCEDGLNLQNNSKYLESIQIFDQAINLDPLNAKAYYNKANSLEKLYKYQAAIEMCDQIIKIDPNNSIAYNLKGNQLYCLKRNDEAIIQYQQFIQLNPKSSIVHCNIGSSFNQLKRYHEAIEMFDLSIKLNDKYALAYNYKGESFFNLQRYEDAIIQYQQVIQLDPNYVQAYFDKGTQFNNLKLYREAIQMFDLVIKVDAKHANAYHHKGESFQNLQRYQEAITLYEQAIKLDPKNIQSYINKGITLNHLRRYQVGIQMFDLAINLGSNNANLYYNKGKSIYNQLRKLSLSSKTVLGSYQIYDEAIKLDPKHVETYLQKGITLNYLEKYQEAIQMFDKAIQLDNKSAVAYINKAISLNNLKRYNESIQMYDQAIKLDPQYKDSFKAFSLSQLKRLEKNEFIKNSLIVFLSLFILIIVVLRLKW